MPIDGVEGFVEVNLEQKRLHLSLFSLGAYLIDNQWAIQNVSAQIKTGLDLINHRADHSLKSVSHGFGYNFVKTPNEADWLVVIQRERVFNFRYKSDKRRTTTPSDLATVFKILNKAHDIVFHQIPIILDKLEGEPVRTWRLLIPAVPNGMLNFFNGESSFKGGAVNSRKEFNVLIAE